MRNRDRVITNCGDDVVRIYLHANMPTRKYTSFSRLPIIGDEDDAEQENTSTR